MYLLCHKSTYLALFLVLLCFLKYFVDTIKQQQKASITRRQHGDQGQSPFTF